MRRDIIDLNGGVSQVIGIIDSNGAVVYKKIKEGDEPTHETYWPCRTHKRWRFSVRDWNVVNSVLTAKLDEAEQDAVLAKMAKVMIPPEWWVRGEAWNKAGRPHGKKGDAFDKRWERCKPKIYREQKKAITKP